MNLSKRIPLVLSLWVGIITALHFWLNIDWTAQINDYLPQDKRKLNVAYIPVT